jgi:hypothetical protein
MVRRKKKKLHLIGDFWRKKKETEKYNITLQIVIDSVGLKVSRHFSSVVIASNRSMVMPSANGFWKHNKAHETKESGKLRHRSVLFPHCANVPLDLCMDLRNGYECWYI